MLGIHVDTEERIVDVLMHIHEGYGITVGASARAVALLLRTLDPGQRQRFLRRGHFTVKAPGWGEFEILPRCIFNVISLQSGITYCAAPDIQVPIADLMLAQKLILENEPAKIFSVANQRY